METYLFASRSFHRYESLNRTMQYGNQKRGENIATPSISLNRTMQYGNPIGFAASQRATWRFKSYYVVWKLKNIAQANKSFASLNRTMQYGNPQNISSPRSTHRTFKSYYVVWKLVLIALIMICSVLFKSYYVVWKRRTILLFWILYIV